MKRIGLIDYYISEWHANNYPTWVRETNQKLGSDYKVAYAWAEVDISPVDGVSTDEWCAKMGITRCASIAEVCERSDVLMILAPTNPETHLRYAKEVLPYGKRTYIDKTFAPNYTTAQEIFALAKRYNTPFFSTSALRYANELKDFEEVQNLILTGGGSNLAEYVIHLAEMAVMLLGDPVKRVCVNRQGKQRVCRAETDGGKQLTILYAAHMKYSANMENSDGAGKNALITSDFFQNLMCDILNFYESGETSFEAAQTLEVMRLRDAILAADCLDGEWITA